MLIESDVIDSVCNVLRRHKFRITGVKRETQRGIDIEAVASNGRRVAVEAKGETSSKRESRRYGKPFLGGSQVVHHVAHVFYKATAIRCCERGVLVGIALPKNAAHEDYVEKILPALKKLQIELFWVLPDRKVQVAGFWKTW